MLNFYSQPIILSLSDLKFHSKVGTLKKCVWKVSVSDGKKLNINIQITFASGDIKVEKNFGTNWFYIKLNTANTTFLHKYCSKKENAQMHFYHHI